MDQMTKNNLRATASTHWQRKIGKHEPLKEQLLERKLTLREAAEELGFTGDMKHFRTLFVVKHQGKPALRFMDHEGNTHYVPLMKKGTQHNAPWK